MGLSIDFARVCMPFVLFCCQYNLGYSVGIWTKQNAFVFQAKACQSTIMGNMYGWVLPGARPVICSPLPRPCPAHIRTLIPWGEV